MDFFLKITVEFVFSFLFMITLLFILFQALEFLAIIFI